jgi:hypothetical protein
MRPLPATLTAEDVTEARSLLLDELLPDFPFATEADRVNAVRLLLLPFVREMISGPTPLHLIEASTAGSGKSLLASSLLSPGIGPASISTLPSCQHDDEWSKRITAALIAGHNALLLDNLNGHLDSGVVAAALTATRWNERILGSSTLADVAVRPVWVATANNLGLSSELVRRCVRIRLEPQTDRPGRQDRLQA